MTLFSKKPPRPTAWQPTCWSLVRTLPLRDDPRWQRSWADLVRDYRAPMESYARSVASRLRGRPCSEEEAGELVQGFLAAQQSGRELAKADPSVRPFRAFVQVLLRRHVGHVVRAERAQKRTPSGGRRRVPLDEADRAPQAASRKRRAEQAAFDGEWVRAALASARARLKSPHDREIVDDLVLTGGEGSPDLAARLGISRDNLDLKRFRARERLARHFEAALRATVADPEAFAEEWRALAPYMP